jgi:hypothetical protein
MRKESRTVDPSHQVDSAPQRRHLPLIDLLVDARAELMELAVASGMKVLQAMLEEDRIAVCGPRDAHQSVRQAVRAGTAPTEVVFGGRKVAIRRPRVRSKATRSPCPRLKSWPIPTRSIAESSNRCCSVWRRRNTSVVSSPPAMMSAPGARARARSVVASWRAPRHS